MVNKAFSNVNMRLYLFSSLTHQEDPSNGLFDLFKSAEPLDHNVFVKNNRNLYWLL